MNPEVVKMIIQEANPSISSLKDRSYSIGSDKSIASKKDNTVPHLKDLSFEEERRQNKALVIGSVLMDK